MKVKLGNKYRDKHTGIEGVAVARFEYENGCIRYQLDLPNADGDLLELVLDEQRLESVNGRTVAATSKAGGSRPKPPRSGSR